MFMVAGVIVSVALRKRLLSPRSTMYSGPGGLFWYAT